MRIITLNVNGLRSAASKGFGAWMRRRKADVVCLQEIKAQEPDLPRSLLAPRGLHAFFHPARKRGYGGVAIYAAREPDLRNWRANRKHSGFLPEECDWLTRVFERHGFVDVFRRLDARPGRYTWWSSRGQARAKNVGWRIDYQVATAGIAALARSSDIYVRRRFSDHAPLTIDYERDL